MRKQIAPAVVASTLAHVMVLAIVVYLTHTTARGRDQLPSYVAKEDTRIVWLSQNGPGGGGGGGGNQQPEPPRRAERPGHDPVTIPVTPSRSIDPAQHSVREPDVTQELMIPAQTLAASMELLAGTIRAPEGPPTQSQGSGKDGGAGTGKGPGDGPGNGSGLGPGQEANTGGKAFNIGSGVSPPIEIHRGTPQYTIDAMRARVQGSFLVECVVQTSGICTDIHIVRTLKPSFGLDDEAIKAARQWRFRPGMRLGQPVPVLVTMQIDFAIR